MEAEDRPEFNMSTLLDLDQSVHHWFRELVQGMDGDQLHWSPGAEMNAIAVIVTHTLGSELDTLLLVRGLASDRDRDSGLRATAASPADVLAAIDRAAALLAEQGEAITADDFAPTRTPVRPAITHQQRWTLPSAPRACPHGEPTLPAADLTL